jgi:hypothetical protein
VKHGIIFIISLVVLFPILSSYAQTNDPCPDIDGLLCVITSEKTYDEGDTIVISGKVTAIIADTPVTLQIFLDKTLVEIAQITVAKDGGYTHTILAQGPLWQNDGKYTVRASYGTSKVETNFDFFTKQSSLTTTDTFEVNAGSAGTFDVDYTIKGATIKDMLVDPDIFALIVIIETEGDGSLTLNLPRNAIDAKTNDGNDDTFIILIDGVEVPYTETTTGTESRTIRIEFEEEDSDIEIIGTFVIPEFEGITILVFIAAVIFIMFATLRKGKSQLIFKTN